jgi:hypothetical protein
MAKPLHEMNREKPGYPAPGFSFLSSRPLVATRICATAVTMGSAMGSTLKPKNAAPDLAATLAQQLSETLIEERLVPRFVDSYVVEHGRYGLQVHAGLYKDLLGLIQREALLAASARAIEILSAGGASQGQGTRKPAPMTRKEAKAFRQKYVAALTRQHRWNVSDALDFQSDLQMYEEILQRAGAPKRARKPFEAANHPFVDRCAFMLDSSFLEKARLAASRTLTDLESLTSHVAESVLHPSPNAKPERAH